MGALLKFDNVPVNRAPKKFKNFVKESLAMFKQVTGAVPALCADIMVLSGGID